MKRILSLLAAAACMSAITYASDIFGSWNGKLQVTPQVALNLVFHIEEDNLAPHGAVVTMDSPDQGAKGIPLQLEMMRNDSIVVEAPQLQMKYAGRYHQDRISGTFTQGPLAIPLELSRGTFTPARPQTPKPPFPYKTKEVVIDNLQAGVKLAGTLTLPDNFDPSTPVVVMVTGSGSQNRDEEILGHRPFAVIADRLARAGIASLRYDARGFAGSTGNAATATTRDLADDAEAAVQSLRAQGYGKVGLLGHSEGGMIAFMLAAGKNAPDFIVTLGAPSQTGAKILLDQNDNHFRKQNIPESERCRILEIISGIYGCIDNNRDMPQKELETALAAYIDECREHNTGNSPLWQQFWNDIKQLPASLSQPWMRYFITSDPAEYIPECRVPALVLYGAKDTQVKPELNMPAIKQLLPRADVRCYPGLNHLMQPCKTGQFEEYSNIETTIDENVLRDITSYINTLK